jgi:hypothetical protein
MFGIFKKKQPSVPPPVHRSAPPPLPGGEPFWDEMGMCRLVPDYIQLHLASRNPQHALSRRADDSIDTGGVPPQTQSDPQIRASITRMMRERLPNDPSILSTFAPQKIVSRLCGIYTEATGKDMCAVVCRKWCVERKLS